MAQPRTVITVRDMLVDRTRANAVAAAEQAKHAETLASATALLPEGLVAASAAGQPLPSLSPEEIAAARDSVDLATVGIAGGLPQPAWWDFQLPPATLDTLWVILPYSLILAGVGLIESLMTLTLVDGLTETRGRLSGITAAVMLLLFILFFADSIAAVPMATGVDLTV